MRHDYNLLVSPAETYVVAQADRLYFYRLACTHCKEIEKRKKWDTCGQMDRIWPQRRRKKKTENKIHFANFDNYSVIRCVDTASVWELHRWMSECGTELRHCVNDVWIASIISSMSGNSRARLRDHSSVVQGLMLRIYFTTWTHKSCWSVATLVRVS